MIITTTIPIVAPRLSACFILDLRDSISGLVHVLAFNKFVTKTLREILDRISSFFSPVRSYFRRIVLA